MINRSISLILAIVAHGIGSPLANGTESALLLADELMPRSYVTVEAGVDGEGSEEASVALDLATKQGARLGIFIGTSSLADDDLRIDADTLRMGLKSDPLNAWVFDIEYEWWGNRDDIEIGAWRVGASWQDGDWSSRLLWESREIRLFTRGVFVAIRPYVDFDSDAWEVAVTYQGWDRWAMTASHRAIDYSVDVTKLGTARLAPYVFTATAFGLGSGLLEVHSSLQVTRYIASGSLALIWDRTGSAVDGTHLSSLTLTSSVALDKAWSLLLQVGGYESGDGDSTAFGSAGFSYAW